MPVDKNKIAKDDLKIITTFSVIVLPTVAVNALFPHYLFYPIW